MFFRAILLIIVFTKIHSKVIIDDEKNENNPYFDGKKTDVPMSAESGVELMQHWLDQAFSGLMAAVSTKKLARLKPQYRRKVHECNKKAKDVKGHALCVVMALDYAQEPTHLLPEEEVKQNKTLDFYAHHRVEHHEDFAGSFRRAKRAIHNQESYVLGHELDRSPLGVISKQITQMIRDLKGKDENEAKNWKTVIAEISEKARELKTREKMRTMLKKRAEYYAKAEKRGDLMDLEIDEHRPLAMPELDDLDDKLEKKEMLEQVRKQMKNMTTEQKAMAAPMQLVRQAVKIGMKLSGNNVSDFENKNINLISPRLFAVVPEDEETKKEEINLLSPSLFSLHNEGDGLEDSLSMTKALETVGLNADTQELMDMILEASGVGDAVEKIKNTKFAEMEKREEIRAPNGQPLYWTKNNVSEAMGEKAVKKVDTMEQLHRMYTPKQLEEMRHSGYTALTPRQLDFVYGPRSPYSNTEALQRFKKSDLSRPKVDEAIHRTIRDVALERVAFKADPENLHKQLDKFDQSKRKDIVLSPIAFLPVIGDPALVSQPLILSPVIFSALVVSPAIFGAIVLSPWLFVAAILSPRILSPVILTPFGFVPIILTPLALTPVILSPGIFNPFVLSPLVLCPFVLSPQAFTPLILTPFALTPFILTPNVLSPIILSPFVLSPIILSPAYVSALVLSPYALSPAIGSNGAVVSVVASPSFLS
ncbi:unnamed protein product, partial [Mesorhabditis belari]|uniref:Uncharacterized protein n=1 Tax=Mesorhabditis belari TaxID=2138241 RepID=A0AAF3J457_9BILA